MAGIIEKFKNIWTEDESEYSYEDEMNDIMYADEEPKSRSATRTSESRKESAVSASGNNKVVNIHATAQLQVVLSKPERFGEETRAVADELIKILDSERIEYTMAGGGVSWAQPWFAYVFLPIGVLALAGGIILLVTSQKNGQGAPVAAGAAAGMGSGKAPARGGRGPVEKRAVLRGVTGKYSGQSFDLLKGKVVIGRDPATCNIVFDKNTPGISGRHCQVVYDPNEDCFIITDLGSSYGTFLGNGKKLTANVAEKLSTGDTFYLCDNANRFVVSKE